MAEKTQCDVWLGTLTDAQLDDYSQSGLANEAWRRGAFIAYNQAIEDVKAAIRGETVDDPYAAPTFINAIARKCSPHVYVNRLTAASAAPVVGNLEQVIADVIRHHHTGRTHSPTYCCPEDEPFYDRQLVRMLVEKLTAAATAAPVEQSEHDSCSHWREGDSDNCVWCGDDLGPTDETDVNEGAR